MTDQFNAHLRLAILRFLEDAPRYTSNSSMLVTILPGVGLGASRDQVAGQCAWLEEQDLVTLEAARPDFLIITATARGVEVAQGIARHPGVQRPGAGG